MAMLGAIAMMEFYLQTGFGESKTSFGRWFLKVVKVMCQGNGELCGTLSLGDNHILSDQGPQKLRPWQPLLQSTIYAKTMYSAGITNVDNTNLVYKAEGPQMEKDGFNNMQEAVSSSGAICWWSPGGAAKP